MSIYKTITGARGGGVRYSRTDVIGEKADGKPKTKTVFTSKKTIPANVLRELESGKDVVDDEGMKLEAPVRECLFCGQPCKLQRLVNMQTVYLCDEDYYGKNIGQIAQRVRELEEGNAKAETTG